MFSACRTHICLLPERSTWGQAFLRYQARPLSHAGSLPGCYTLGLRRALPLCKLQSAPVPRTSELRATCTFPDARGDASQVLPPLGVTDSAGRPPWVPSQAHGGVGEGTAPPHMPSWVGERGQSISWQAAAGVGGSGEAIPE